MKVKVSLDNIAYLSKPKKGEIGAINNRIAKQPVSMELHKLADKIGNKGCSFCPASFLGGKRRIDSFQEMQLFVLDFDGGVSLKNIEERAKRYRLKIAFKYHTFSSTEEVPKFRIAFVNDVPITDKRIAKMMIMMLLRIFYEADQSCKDVSRMFFGGKGLIGEIQSESINIVDLAVEYQHFVFDKDSKNYKREIENFVKLNDIWSVNTCLGITKVRKDGTIEGFWACDQYEYGSVAKFPSFMPRYAVISGYQPHVRNNTNNFSKIRLDMSCLKEQCQLYCDFIKEPHISHSQRFLLMTNMLHIRGGKSRFLSIIEKKDYDKRAWRFYLKYAKDREYKPQGCDGACPYAHICNHKANMVLTLKARKRIIKIKGKEEFYAVEEVYEYIYNSMEDAINQRSKGIYLIPAQTAIGKTQAYCDLISRYEHKRFIVAVPTNRLKREVEGRLKSKGVTDILVTPSLDEMELPEGLKGEIKRLYQQGLGRKVADALRRFIKENKRSEDPEIIGIVESCKKYLHIENELPNKRVLVTTHARLVTLTEDIIAHHQVIVDEDILSTFFKNIREVSNLAIQKALKIKSIPVSLEERLRQIQDAEDGRYECLNGSIDNGYISDEVLEREEIWEDINDIAFASTFHKDGEVVHYFYPQMLQKGKYIILSATIDKSLYEEYFQGWWIKSYPYFRAEYKGRLVQMTEYSMSRACIQNHKEKLMKYVKQFDRGYDIITFQCFEDEFRSRGLHFGNTEGVDQLKGKNILIIGTPHQNEVVYKLIGCHLGMEVNEDVLSERRVNNGGYEFVLMTFKGERLRNLQIYFIKRELEQSIGRARLLREECQVVVLSNFPCEQAELNQEDYLGPIEEEENDACGPDMAGKI